MKSDDFKPSGADVLHAITKSVISQMPIVGGLSAELFGLFISTPLEKRKDLWIQSLTTKIDDLEQKSDLFKIEKLVDNEIFITTVIHATQIAIKNHRKEKIECLRNAVINSVIADGDEFDEIPFYLNLVDTLTVLHLDVFTLLYDRITWFNNHNKNLAKLNTNSVRELMEYAFGINKDKMGIVLQALKILYNYGLTEYDLSLDSAVINSLEFPIQTQLGKSFLRFISNYHL